MNAEQLKKLSDILYSENKSEVVKLVQSINAEDELFVLLDNYNWDNGFEVPEAIITHTNCTLSVALLAFYRADGLRYLFEGEDAFANPLLKSWKTFIKEIYDKILKEHYPIGNISYDPEITNIQKFKLKKLHPNLSSFILDGVSGKDLHILL
ncbi:DUF4274 domain-containing protein [Streptococcus sp. Marseille-Q4154]|uniref:DUF4274 domain-containing protein n=1 Tax=Streptococcus sp. Marseille-Q4154 TaxID=2866598 RepID=UPI001CE4B20C|nr:DUF4274 domain-containing protein [Streptococcus sp. Marseille-Q4154]